MHKVFEFITEVIGWIAIVASPLLIGVILGGIVYLNIQTTAGLVLGLIIAAVGLVAGIIWATNRWKKGGTLNFLSRVSATPDIDKMLQGQNKPDDNNNNAT
jgi:hypothetical protein